MTGRRPAETRLAHILQSPSVPGDPRQIENRAPFDLFQPYSHIGQRLPAAVIA